MLPPLVLIAGPTASGKSDAALALAERLGGTIVNADSAQVYRDLRILSARPSAAEEARAPHRLFGHVDGAEACSAARWASEAKAAIAEVHGAASLPILVGGSGLYIRTLLDGIAAIPAIPDSIRDEVRALSIEELRTALERDDPATAARLAPRDSARTARALEVIRATGRPLLEWQRERSGGIAGTVDLRAVVIDPPRALLYERCDRRAEAMIAAGALGEVAALAARRLPADLPVMRAIGVRPLADHLAGRTSREDAMALIQQQTRNYAKRQATWLRHQADPAWERVAQWEACADHLIDALCGRVATSIL